MLEAVYQADLIERLYDYFPGCEILKQDSGYRQGIPDLLVLLPGGGWFMLEVKASAKAKTQPNQEYYIEKYNEMCFAAFIYPENEEEIIRALQQTFLSRRTACFPKP